MTSEHTDTQAAPVSGTPSKKHRSPSDLRRDAARAQKRIEQRLAERSEAWSTGDGRDPFTVLRQDGEPTLAKGDDGYLRRNETPGSLRALNVEKRHAMYGLQLGSKEL